jgi:uncharacterized membrane protein YfcA
LILAWRWILWATAGVVLGTFLGMRFLRQISEPLFRRVLGAFIFLLGVYMLYPGAN